MYIQFLYTKFDETHKKGAPQAGGLERGPGE